MMMLADNTSYIHDTDKSHMSYVRLVSKIYRKKLFSIYNLHCRHINKWTTFKESKHMGFIEWKRFSKISVYTQKAFAQFLLLNGLFSSLFYWIITYLSLSLALHLSFYLSISMCLYCFQSYMSWPPLICFIPLFCNVLLLNYIFNLRVFSGMIINTTEILWINFLWEILWHTNWSGCNI